MSFPSPYEHCLLHHKSRYTVSYLQRLHSLQRLPSLTQDQLRDVPNEGIFKTLVDHDARITNPTVAECAAHLELLEAFLILKRKVIKSKKLDTTFGLKPSQGTAAAVLVAKSRLVKWDKFVSIAVVRFEAWWKSITTIRNKEEHVIVNVDTLPPIERRKYGGGFLSDGLPWAAIHRAIDHSSRDYTLTDTAKEAFRDATGLDLDLLEWLKKSESLQETALVTSAAPEVFSVLSKPWLVAAVRREANFAEKMGHFLWIRSPSLVQTLTRAGLRYEHFFELAKLYPETALAPTLDIDLVWRTHQCAPYKYSKYSEESTGGRLISHSDITEKKLMDAAFSKTKELFQIHFVERYLRCLCWDCEALLTVAEDNEDNSTSSAKVKANVSNHRCVEMRRRQGKS